MISIARQTRKIELPLIDGEFSMIPFNLNSMDGLNGQFKQIAQSMIDGIPGLSGIGYFTIHGKKLSKGQTLRRGGAHTDGSYDKSILSWGGGWKVGENGPSIDSDEHARLYKSSNGGIILVSNFEACIGWKGEFEGFPGVGGDCSHISLNDPFTLKKDTVYYGNNHFIHESLPMSQDVHRVFARITLPETHTYQMTV